MTITTSASSVTYQGTGTTTLFPFPFPVNQATDLQVILTDTTVTPPAITTLAPTQYALQGIGAASGGTVAYPVAGPPLAPGQALSVNRVVPYVQTTSLQNQSGFYPAVIEGALDTLTMQTQQLADQLGRSVQVPVGSGIDPASYLAAAQTAEANAAASAAAAAAVAGSAVFATVAAVRTLAGAALPVLYLRGWAADGDGGEGFFRYDPTDTASADNGGTILVDAAGHRYKRNLAGLLATPKMFGAKGDCRTVSDGAIAAGSATLTSNTIAFTAADLGKAVSVLGAGAGGATLNTTIAAVAGGTNATLAAAASTTVTGAGVSLGSDDTTVLQNWFDYLANNGEFTSPGPVGHAGHWTRGRYKITAGLTFASGFYIPNMITDGADYVQLDGWSVSNGTVLTFFGGTAASANAEWQGLTVDAGTTANATDGVRVTGVGWWTFKNVKVFNCANALRLYNNTSNPFTEGFVAEHWAFDASNLCWLRYTNDPGGTNSFRSSGLRGCFGHPSATGSSPIVIDNGAAPYFSPMSFSVWAQAGGGPLIANNSGVAATFEGDITIEGGPVVIGGGATDMYLRGGIIASYNNDNITKGTLYTCDDIQPYFQNGVQLKPFGKYLGATTTVGETISVPVQYGQNLSPAVFVSVSISCPNYQWNGVIVAVDQGGVGGTFGASLLTQQMWNGTGYGAPTLGTDTNGNITLTNASYPVGTTATYTAMTSAVTFPQ